LDKKTIKKLRGFGQKYSIFIVLGLLGYGLYVSKELTTILAGIAIFLVGMILMEDGFKALAGGAMQSILKKLTSNIYKSIFGGFILTSIVQSSSLVSVIAISFISAGFIGLSEAIGIIFGANLGTTTTAWIVAYFGLKIKISAYAMPMLVFGIVLHFFKDNSTKGVGNILLGLGLIFLGVGYMKEGFETIQASIDISQFAMEGFLGLMVYAGLGIIITVVIQSSSATMALVLTALATNQITYENALALAIGANVGTTVTALLGSLTSNSDGKRLAMAHLVFNIITGLIAIIFISQIAWATNVLSNSFGISDDVLKLALFHTIFNTIGIVVMVPFIPRLVIYLNRLFVTNKNLIEPKYINHDLVASADMSIQALEKEVEHLYKNAFKIISSAINIKSKELKHCDDVKCLLETDQKVAIDIDKSYETLIKPLEAEITNFVLEASANMNETQTMRADDIRMATRDIVETIKEIKHLKKNIDKFQFSEKKEIKKEYNLIRSMIAEAIKSVKEIAKEPDNKSIIQKIAKIKIEQQRLNSIKNRRVDTLIKENKIDTYDIISLMNDSSYTNNLIFKLCDLVEHLYINKDEKIKATYIKYQSRYIPSEENVAQNGIIENTNKNKKED
jgi:phosphate:Na+ symporter